jgi:hypothetical protein
MLNHISPVLRAVCAGLPGLLRPGPHRLLCMHLKLRAACPGGGQHDEDDVSRGRRRREHAAAEV